MPKVVMYATQFCPYCSMARHLLKNKHVTFEEINADKPGKWDEMEAKSGRSTVPQIWIGERHVGGYDDLNAADKDGLLDGWLSALQHQN